MIGARANTCSDEDALKHVAGFVLHNDYSERGFQLERSGQWTKGKSADGFAPLGPFLATPDELPGFAAAAAVAEGQRRDPSRRATPPT